MDRSRLAAALEDQPLGGIYFFETVASTNDLALARAAEEAADLVLFVAEEQTGGRGRVGRRWYTPPGAALAFSLVLRPTPGEQLAASFFPALGALAVVSVLEKYGMKPEIKWPNDVLLGRRKVAGILAESAWTGDAVDALVLGIGVNVSPVSVPPLHLLSFPATCLETVAGRAMDRLVLLRDLIAELIAWRRLLRTRTFFDAWQERLAFRGEQVEVWGEGGVPRPGLLEGLDPDGSLRLRSPGGGLFSVQFGDVHLRPVV